MMGRQRDDQGQLFYEFRLEDRVPADHLLRKINPFVDLSDLRSHLAPFYSTMGRPSVDPELMIRMLLVGYCFGIRSERRLVSVACIVAVGVNSDGRREVLGLDIAPSEAEPFWTEFLRNLRRRGLSGVKLVVSDSHEGIKAAVSKVLHACWQRCRVHFMRNALAHAGRQDRRVVSAFIGTAFVQDDADAARTQWRSVAD